MAKLEDLCDWEKLNNPAIDLNGDIICPGCLTNKAIITDYGMIRKCKKCQKNHIPTIIHAVIKEGGKNKFY